MNPTIDPTIKNLVSSIGQAETGASSPQAYQQKGASGEFGRYQFMNDSWNAWTKQYGLDPNDKSIANQNKVAYMRVQDRKNAGLSPAEIASEWNSGNKNAYKENHVGTNSKGVKFDTPTYTAKVSQYYQQLKAGQPLTDVSQQTPTDQPVQEEQHGLLGSIASGLLKTPARIATNLINAGQEIVGKPTTQPFSGKFLGEVKPIGMENGGGLSLANLKESVGAGAEIGSYLIPVGGAGKIGEATLGGLVKEGAIQGLKTGALAGGVGGVGNAMANNKGLGETAVQGGLGALGGGALGGTLGALAPLATKGLNKLGMETPKLTAIKDQNELSQIQDRISPKPTVKEARLAQSQGRLVAGEKPTLFKSGTVDTILPTEKVVSASKTIQKNIPDAVKMTDPELYDALDKKISETATQLKPKMQKVQVDPETVRKINNDWKVLKSTQTKDPYLSNDVNIKNLQKDFETRLKNTKGSTMDDLWTARKLYDDSVPANVKNANSMSSEALQNKRTIWLQNRKIFNDAINDTSFGLGKTSKTAFSDMSNLYEAQKGLQSKAKINTKPVPSKIGQLVQKHPVIAGTVLGGAATATGIPKKALDLITGGAL